VQHPALRGIRRNYCPHVGAKVDFRARGIRRRLFSRESRAITAELPLPRSPLGSLSTKVTLRSSARRSSTIAAARSATRLEHVVRQLDAKLRHAVDSVEEKGSDEEETSSVREETRGAQRLVTRGAG
jgi:hypothetical protein